MLFEIKMNGIDNQRHIVLNLRAQLFHTAVNSQNNKNSVKYIVKCLLMLAGNVCICKALWVSKRALAPVQCAVGLVGTVPASSGGGGGINMSITALLVSLTAHSLTSFHTPNPWLGEIKQDYPLLE